MRYSGGFTIVEMLVTVVLSGIFLTFFIQMYRATNAQQQSLIRQSIANDMARSNLAKFPTATSITSATCAGGRINTSDCSPSGTPQCDSTGTSTNSANNIKVRKDAQGTSINLAAEANPGKLGTVTQSIRAAWPQGCGANVPIKLTSRVEYVFGGGQSNTVEYSTYVF